MILTLDSDIDVKPKEIEQSDIIVNRATIPDDPPPAYADSQKTPAAGPVNDSLAPIPLPDSVKPINFLSLSRGNTSIKGKYVIDPRIKIPQCMLPPLSEDETEATRKNVLLHTSNGSIDADVFVIGDVDFKQKVHMSVKTSNGAVVVRVHASAAPRPPMHIKARSSNGSVTLHIPRSFRGPVTIRTSNGSVRFSDSISTHLTTFSEVKKTRRCFIGDYTDWTDQPEGWIGDELDLETSNGTVKLQYDVEPNANASNVGSPKGKGLLAKLFGA
ncbi:hypothetical protein MSAN_01967100 [Mycena sanguinolenta]|uniref:DUF7330 domain-containing protein n=1 Tax=Mycena sanguinolenta TaxID=230812 RepID=A0A8H7CQK7_9AGAR|nr:hypothetical protein MSAN_01967100 [Mycena sanguinolenta]